LTDWSEATRFELFEKIKNMFPDFVDQLTMVFWGKLMFLITSNQFERIKNINSMFVYEYAIRFNWKNLEMIENQSDDLCWFAIKICKEAIRYCKIQTDSMVKYVVCFGELLQYVKPENKTLSICFKAIKLCNEAMQFVPEKYIKICEAYRCGLLKTEDVQFEIEKLLPNEPSALKYFMNQTYEICKSCVFNDPLCILFVQNPRHFTRQLICLALCRVPTLIDWLIRHGYAEENNFI
jgi:hypothetical protein